MAITTVSVSAVADGTSAVTLTYPAGIVVGQLISLGVLSKAGSAVPDAIGSFVLEGRQVGGIGSESLSDSGTVVLSVYTREADGSESGTTLTVNVPGGNVTQAVLLVHEAAPGSTFDSAAAQAAQDTPVALWSVPMGSNPGLAAGDVVVVFMGINSNSSAVAGLHSQAVSAPGVTTWSAAVEHVDLSTSTGRDQHIGVSQHAVVAGTSSGAPTYTVATSVSPGANSPTGAVVMLRLREVAAPQPPQIVANPEARSVVQPNAATFTANITGADTLQWLRRSGGTGTPANVVGGSGANTLTYVTGATSISGGNHNNGDTYALQATNAQGTVTTTYAPLTVNEVGADSTPPSAPGTPAPSGLTKTAVTMTHAAATDNVGVTGYEYQIDAEAVVNTNSTALAVAITGRTAGTTISYRVRAYDAAGNRSAWSAAVNVTFPIYGFSFNSLPGYQAGSFVGSLVGLGLDVGVGVVVRANDDSTGAVVAVSGTMTTDTNGRLSRWTHPALDLGVTYELVFRRVSDGARDIKRAVAT